jgi:hypothetical protein
MLERLFIIVIFFAACNRNEMPAAQMPAVAFSEPVKVEVKGYNGNIMEPFITRDGNILLFNNLNAAPENTNLYWAVKINDSSFDYKGEVSGVNTQALEAVPSMDNSGHLYFVSTRNYDSTLSTIYESDFSNGIATNVQLVGGISKKIPGWVNFDIEVSADGQNIYFVDAQFDQTGNPKTADLVIAEKTISGFQRLSNSDGLLKNINTSALEYAACISTDQLELYFTRVTLPLSANSFPEILVSVRKNKTEPFGLPSKIPTITGFAEAPTIAPDQSTLYYHKKENNKFVLYMVRKN